MALKINFSLDTKAEYDAMMMALESQRAFAFARAGNHETPIRDRDEARRSEAQIAALIKKLSGQ
jgi:hypothetical protein